MGTDASRGPDDVCFTRSQPNRAGILDHALLEREGGISECADKIIAPCRVSQACQGQLLVGSSVAKIATMDP